MLAQVLRRAAPWPTRQAARRALCSSSSSSSSSGGSADSDRASFRKRLRVTGVDARLIALEEDTAHGGGAIVSVGDLLFTSGSTEPVGVVAFQGQGLFFGAQFEGAGTALSAGGELGTLPGRTLGADAAGRHEDQAVDASSVLAFVGKESGLPGLFRHQPRDTEREVITDGWSTGVTAVDALTPIGLGQSMLFTSDFDPLAAAKRDNFMLDCAVGALVNATNPEAHVWFAVPPASNDVAGAFQVEALEARLSDEGVRERCTLVTAREGGDSDVSGVLCSFVACALAERLAAAYYEKERGHLPANLFAPGSDRADLRQFYSALIQRSARLEASLGGGTLTTLQGVFLDPAFQGVQRASGHDRVGKALRETAAPVRQEQEQEQEAIPLRDLMQDTTRSPAELNRLKAIADRGIPLTPKVLSKLGIRVPTSEQSDAAAVSDPATWGLSGPLVTGRTQTQHAEELKSISDGHISMQHGESALFDFAVGDSLTRIGIGISKNRSRDTRPPALRQVAGPLRLELSSMFDLDPHNRAPPAELLQYAAALRHEPRCRVPLHVEVGLLLALARGILTGQAAEGGSRSAFARALGETFPAALREAIERCDAPLSEAQLSELVDYLRDVAAQR